MAFLRVRKRREQPRRRPRRSLSVRTRILLSILATTALGLLAAGVASYVVQGERVRSAVDERLLHSVSELKAIAEGQSSETAPATVEELLKLAIQRLVPATNEGVVGFINGEPALVPSTNLPFRIERDAALVERIVDEAHPRNVVIGTAKADAGTLRYAIVPVRVEGDPNTGLYVAAYNLDTELGAVAMSFRTYIVVAVLALILVGAVAWIVAGRLLRPIRLLREAAASSSTAADLTERVPSSGRDDVSELAEAINGMFDRLQESSQSQRRLLDDIGHELKTPITIIRGHLELLDLQNPADVEGTRLLAIDELDRMSTLVSDISFLAETGNPHFIEPVEVDLASFTATVGSKASALDPARDWNLASADGLALFDPRRLTQAWLQLAENAVKYSTPHQPITLASEVIQARTHAWLEFSVRDSGPGIPEGARARIFERFQRLEATRSASGAGLGLTIVSAIAEAHGGTVTLDDSPEGGAIFVIRIPFRSKAEGNDDDTEDMTGSTEE
ncbi:MAG TPA: HAMP domain-containing sensor histidine kinase [Homoserinimonas sp.]|nr:HAMP domain-containing sensor histidine kinase [Homoserinimonas sp.]